ncbi:DUF3040 domain-containing protein [Salsipaludibacter albus]|uniref:DUF3040 domain-containing protein n=1 Tax=Salsipaludibacter albus TaxID=2849650 RepID=UPI001EE3CE52|nr:DUF3040 domain-containing protein [Salsipaludibacter albus]MBY5163229.1 DUF3040 domain-containing protein [Salsipaludibacter albus]
MPLSEHEERVLAEMERRLVAEDPRFVARTQRAGQRVDRATEGTRDLAWRLRASVAGVVLGVLSLLGLTFSVWFGVAGFALLLVSVTVLVSTLRTRRDQALAGADGRDNASADDDGHPSNGLR